MEAHKWRNKYRAFDCPTQSVLIVHRSYKIKTEVLNLLNIKCNADGDLHFPFYDPYDEKTIIGHYLAGTNNKGAYKKLNRCAHDYVYPSNVPGVSFNKEETLYIVKTPAIAAEYLSQGKNAVAYCYRNRISDNLITYIGQNGFKKIKPMDFDGVKLKDKLNQAGYYKFSIL
jgi:hypothetical protein